MKMSHHLARVIVWCGFMSLKKAMVKPLHGDGIRNKYLISEVNRAFY